MPEDIVDQATPLEGRDSRLPLAPEPIQPGPEDLQRHMGELRSIADRSNHFRDMAPEDIERYRFLQGTIIQAAPQTLPMFRRMATAMQPDHNPQLLNQERALEDARERHAGTDEGFVHTLLRRLPGARQGQAFAENLVQSGAQERYQRGEATMQDVDNIARMERLGQLAGQRSGDMADTVLGLPAMATEMLSGARAAQAIAPSAGLVGGAARLGAFTATQPGYLAEGVQRNTEAGRGALNLTGMGQAFTLDTIRNGIFMAASNPAAGGITGYLRNLGAGMGASETMKEAEGLLGISTGHGAIGALIEGRHGEAFRELATDALSIGTLQLMHGGSPAEARRAVEHRLSVADTAPGHVEGAPGETVYTPPGQRGPVPAEERPTGVPPNLRPQEGSPGRPAAPGAPEAPARRPVAALEGQGSEEAKLYHIADYKNPEKSAGAANAMLERRGSPVEHWLWDGPESSDNAHANLPRRGVLFQYDRRGYVETHGAGNLEERGTGTSYGRGQVPMRYDPSLERLIYHGERGDAAFGRLQETVRQANLERGDAALMQEYGHGGPLPPIDVRTSAEARAPSTPQQPSQAPRPSRPLRRPAGEPVGELGDVLFGRQREASANRMERARVEMERHGTAPEAVQGLLAHFNDLQRSDPAVAQDLAEMLHEHPGQAGRIAGILNDPAFIRGVFDAASESYRRGGGSEASLRSALGERLQESAPESQPAPTSPGSEGVHGAQAAQGPAQAAGAAEVGGESGPPAPAASGAVRDLLTAHEIDAPLLEHFRQMHGGTTAGEWTDLLSALRSKASGEGAVHGGLGEGKLADALHELFGKQSQAQRTVLRAETPFERQHRAFALRQQLEVALAESRARAAGRSAPEVKGALASGLQEGVRAAQSETDEGTAEQRAAAGSGTIPGVPFRTEPTAADATTFGRRLRPGEPSGMMAGGQEAPEGSRPPMDETALANARIDQERQARGDPPILGPARLENQEVWDRAMERLARDPEAAAKLIEDLTRNPRATTVEENALILQRKIALENEWKREFGRYLEQRRTGSLAEAETQYRRVLERMDQWRQVEDVARKTGTEWGRAGQFRRQLAKEDYSLGSMMNQFRAEANREATPQEAEQILRMHEQIAALRQRAEEAENALGALQRRPKETAEEAALRAATSPEWKARTASRGELRMGEDQFRSLLQRARNENASPVEKTLGWLDRLIRFNVLSGPRSLLKIGAAATENMVMTPLGDMVSSMWRQVPGIKEIARMAPRFGGGFDWSIEQRAKASAVTEGLKDGLEKLKYGQSSLGAQHGGEWYSRGLVGESAAGKVLDAPGLTHAFIKAIPEREEYTRSFLKRQQWSARIGEDATNPRVMDRNSALAYIDAEHSILMNKNIVTNAINRATNYLRSQGLAGKLGAAGIRATFPILRVPTNLVARTLEYTLGTFTGLGRAGHVFARGIETLQPDQADLIMRNLSRGSIGLAMLATGYFLGPKVVPAFYSGNRQDRGDEADVSDLLMHHPAMMAARAGASIAQNERHEGIVGGTATAAQQVLGELPFVRGARELVGLTEANRRGKALAGYVRELTQPAFLSFIGDRADAMQMGRGLTGQTPRRAPKTFLQNLQMGVPGLRQNVPLASR